MTEPTNSDPTNSDAQAQARAAILEGRTSLGIELGSTRIKACLVGEDPTSVLAVGSHEWENRFVDRVWTYSLEDVWSGLQAAYADLVADVRRRYDVEPQTFGAIGVSAMMHGYLAFDADDELLVPFRTWRNTSTGPAAAELSEQFGLNIPLRWSIAHLHQAVLDEEPHVPQHLLPHHARRVRALAAHGSQGASAWATPRGCSRSTPRRTTTTPDCSRCSTGSSRTARPDLHLADLLPEVLPAGREAGELTARGRRTPRPIGCAPARRRAVPARGRRRHRHGRDVLGRAANRQRQRRHEHLRDGRARAAPRARPPRARPGHHAGGRPRGDGALQQRRERARGVGGRVRAVRRRRPAVPVDTDAVFEALFREALEGEADAGGLLAYNYLAGEPIAGLAEGRPLIVRTPDSRLTLANFMRAQLYGVYGTLALGMRVLADEGVELDRMFAHGGIFRTAGVAQRLLAGALDAPVAVGGDRVGRRCLGHRRAGVVPVRRRRGRPRGRTSSERVFANAEFDTVDPVPEDVAGFSAFLDRYRAGLAAEAAAVDGAVTERATTEPRIDTPPTSHQTSHQGDAHDPHPPHHLARRVRGLVPHRQPAPLRRGDPASGRRRSRRRSPRRSTRHPTCP